MTHHAILPHELSKLFLQVVLELLQVVRNQLLVKLHPIIQDNQLANKSKQTQFNVLYSWTLIR